MYTLLRRLFPVYPPPDKPQRIVLIHPCCMGDVVMATAALQALRGHYPDAHITWAVGRWSRKLIETHDLLDALLDTGPAANPAKANLLRLAGQLRRGNFDLAVSFVRSPLMSLAVLLSGIPHRAGLDSLGRGFGYSLRVPISPQLVRHEAQFYLDVVAALGAETQNCYVNVPVAQADVDFIRTAVKPPYFVVNPAGGSNPGMLMHSKRWPPQHFAALIKSLPHPVVLLGGPGDEAIINAVQAHLASPLQAFVGNLSFGQIAALAHCSAGYIGNDTGLTHYAAAAGARTVMILGPSDPARYAPFRPDSLALWKPTALKSGGVSAGSPQDWDWLRDGISADEAIEKVLGFFIQNL